MLQTLMCGKYKRKYDESYPKLFAIQNLLHQLTRALTQEWQVPDEYHLNELRFYLLSYPR